MIKITPIELIEIWNVLADIELVNESLSPEFSVFVKRFRISVSDDVTLWNKLSIEERTVIMDEEIEYRLKKLRIDSAPEIIPDHYREVLNIIFEEALPVKKSNLQQIIERKNEERADPKED